MPRRHSLAGMVDRPIAPTAHGAGLLAKSTVEDLVKYGLLWLIGVSIPVLILIYFLFN